MGAILVLVVALVTLGAVPATVVTCDNAAPAAAGGLVGENGRPIDCVAG